MLHLLWLDDGSSGEDECMLGELEGEFSRVELELSSLWGVSLVELGSEHLSPLFLGIGGLGR